LEKKVNHQGKKQKEASLLSANKKPNPDRGGEVLFCDEGEKWEGPRRKTKKKSAKKNIPPEEKYRDKKGCGKTR